MAPAAEHSTFRAWSINSIPQKVKLSLLLVRVSFVGLLCSPLQDAGLSDVANAWEDVKDFKWHRAQQSPNWGIIPQGDRESDPLAKATLN